MPGLVKCLVNPLIYCVEVWYKQDTGSERGYFNVVSS